MKKETVADRLPPFSESTEQSILGCVLLDPQNSIPEVAAKGYELFYDLRHQIIFDAARELMDEHKPVDTVTLMAKLKAKNLLESVGGIAYLSSLPDAVPSAANLSYYLEIVVEHAVRRKIIQASTAAVSQAYTSEGDSITILDDAEKALSEISKGLVGDAEVDTPTLMDGAMERLEAAYNRGDKIEGISTGFSDLDRMTNGLKAGEMIVIAARPAMGKTSLAMNIAEHVGTDLGLPVGIFSLEMTKESLAIRMLCSRAGINERDIRSQKIASNQFKSLGVALGQLKKSNLHIDDTAGLSIMQLRARARRMSRKHSIRLLVIDYLQLLTASNGRKDSNREQEIARISNGVKALAKELSIPVIVLAQLNREIDKDKKRKPRLSDLRESGAIEQDADIIGMLYAPPKEGSVESDIIPINLLIAKQRNGPTGDVPFTFFKGITRFKLRAKVD